MAIEFQKGSSTLHNLDARTKLLMFIAITVAAVVIIDPILMSILFLTLYFLGTRAINRKLLNQNLRVLVVVFLTFTIFQVIFFAPNNAYFLFYLVPFTHYIPITVQGLIRGVAVFFRFFSVVLAVHLMLYTTPPVELALTITERGKRKFSLAEIVSTLVIGSIMIVSLLPTMQNVQKPLLPIDPILNNLVIVSACLVAAFAVQKLAGRGLPPEMGVALTLGFSTVGILTEQTQKITDAQKARGYDVKPKNLIRRVQVLTALLIPIFLATLERSQDISIAILSRGFDYNISARTFRRFFEFRRIDYIFIGAMVLIIILGMLLNQFNYGNLTEQFIMKLIS
jgi:energy-coupling factor transporter transmembrane protein EcfT